MNFRALLISVVAVVVTAFLIAILLFVANRDDDPNLNQVGGLEVAGGLTLDADISILSLTSDSEGFYTVTYRYMISNFTESTVYELAAINPLQAEFDPYPVLVTSINSTNLTVNPNFNGSTDMNLLQGGDSLLPGQTESIEITLQFNPGEDTGPFNNNVSVTGTTTDPSAPDDESEDGGADQGGGGDSEEPNDGDPDTPGDGGDNPDDPDIPNDEPGDEGEEIDYTNLSLTLWIVDSQTSTRLFELQPGTVIDVGELGSFSIEAVPNQEFSGSIEFIIPNSIHRRVENFSSYMMFGNSGSISSPWDLGGGNFSLEVRAYPNQSAQGTVVAFETRQFQVEIPMQQGVVSGSGSISFTLEPNQVNQPSQSDEQDDSEQPSRGNDQNDVLEPAQEDMPPQSTEVPYSVGNNDDVLVSAGLQLRKSFILGMLLIIAPITLALLSQKLRNRK
jgi:hypothetical protein